MYASVKTYAKDIDNKIRIKNTYLITGLSSRDWLKQTRERFPEILRSNIYHRSDLTSFVQKIEGVSNAIIIMDEIQVAAKENQSIHKAFKSLGLLDKSSLYERDIKIVEFTATPDGTIYDLMKWGDASRIIVADNCDDYTSSFDLLNWREVVPHKIQNLVERIEILEKTMEDEEDPEELNMLGQKLTSLRRKIKVLEKNADKVRVKQYKDLWGRGENGELSQETIDAIEEVKADIESYDTPRYHTFRTKTGGDQTAIEDFKEYFPCDTYDFIYYNSGCKDEFNEFVRRGGKSTKCVDDGSIDINDLLNKKPKKHTIIFIKEMLRCAKTTTQTYKGVSYERFVGDKSMNDTVIIQGVLGRNNGYNDNGDSICYTNIETITKYKELLDSKFTRTDIKWKSNTTKFIDDVTVSTKTFNTLKPETPAVVEPTPKKVKIVKEKKEKKEKVVKEKKEKIVRETGAATATRRVPVIVDGFDGTEPIFGKLGAKKREEFVENVLKNRVNDPKCVRLYNYITNEKVRIGKTQLPDPAEYNIKKSSYDKHINDVVAAADNNKPYSVSGRHTSSNNWSLFIDAKYNRLCIIPLVVDDELY